MINKEDIVEIGQFRRTHALKGELNATLEVGDDFFDEEVPLITEVDGIYVPFFVDSVRTKGAESFLLKLSGVNSADQASAFVNKPIFAKREDVEDYFGEEGLELPEDFIGYSVIEVDKGKIGTVTRVDDATDNVLFLVDPGDGSTIFIPAAEEFITNIDDDHKIIQVSLPEGLINLND